MTTPAYPINVFWSDEDEAWVADVPDLAYCSAVGDTPHEAVAEVAIAMAAWIDAPGRAAGPYLRLPHTPFTPDVASAAG